MKEETPAKTDPQSLSGLERRQKHLNLQEHKAGMSQIRRESVRHWSQDTSSTCLPTQGRKVAETERLHANLWKDWLSLNGRLQYLDDAETASEHGGAVDTHDEQKGHPDRDGLPYASGPSPWG